jgi:hypothetical protein
LDRITWHRRSNGQPVWDGIAGSLSLFTIEPSPAPHAAWMLRTRLPIQIDFTMAVRHHGNDDRQ